jgi:uncharacterized protein
MEAVDLASLKSPGVYVKEVDSGIKSITGVSTSTAGFIGILSSSGPLPAVPKTEKQTDSFTGDGAKKSFDLTKIPANTTAGSYTVKIDDAVVADATISATTKKGTLALQNAPTTGAKISVEYDILSAISIQPATPVPAPVPVLCTNFGEFKKAFSTYFVDDITACPSNFSKDSDFNYLAHGVAGFFNNGGSRCYVVCSDKIADALLAFEKIDEISIIAAPGKFDKPTQEALVTHCTTQQGIFYRVAILDGVDSSKIAKSAITEMGKSDYAALYYPWIKVADPKNSKNTLDVPPSGAIAGIYARVDSDRGVHKAPANETVRGALGITQPLSKPDQDGLNPDGINCIRLLNNNITVWGARTLGGDANQDTKYINVRRTLLYLRKSIDQSTQWVVFEPNTPALWQKINRNVTAFLTTVWRSGALFGNTPEEAFYVKCDAETNPFEVREKGAVVTEIGVAIARPAEFVVFQISQWTGPGQ